MIARWTVYTAFTLTWVYALGCLITADRPIEYLAAAVAFVVVPLCMIPMVEEVER